jgi:hypothetical protein
MDVKRLTHSLCIRSLVATYLLYKKSLIRGHFFHLLINSSRIREVETYQGTVSIVHITSFFSHLLSNHMLSFEDHKKHFSLFRNSYLCFQKADSKKATCNVYCTHFLLRLFQIFHKTVLRVKISDSRSL